MIISIQCLNDDRSITEINIDMHNKRININTIKGLLQLKSELNAKIDREIEKKERIDNDYSKR